MLPRCVLFISLVILCAPPARSAVPALRPLPRSLAVSSAVRPQITASPKAPAAKQKAKLETYELRIPKTTTSIKMIAIPKTEAGGGFWMSETELPWEAFDVFAQGLDLSPMARRKAEEDAITRPSKPYLPPDRGFGHKGYPAISMTRKAAIRYCEWLAEKTGHAFRLPTEAEWEYAAREGKAAPPVLRGAALDAVAWHWDNASEKTQRVGRKKANAFGLHDMLGNVAEWCSGKDKKPVARGGSWEDEAKDVTWKRRQLQTSEWNASDPQIPKSPWWLADCGFVGIRLIRVPKKR